MANKNFVVKNNLEVTGGTIEGPATFNIDPAAVGDNTGTLVVKGNLQVDGTQTTINSTTLTVDDKKITVAEGAGSSSAADEAGIEVGVGAVGASSNPSILYEHDDTSWNFNKPVNVTGAFSASGNITGTLATAAQTNITSLGTISSLTVSGAVTAGSVNASGGYLNGSNGGIRIHSGGTKFFNVTAANAARDNIMDIGAADARFKNLHLAGVANIDGGAIFNEDSADVDFRVESNSGTHMLFVDGGEDRVGIGNSTPGSYYGNSNQLVVGSGAARQGITIASSTSTIGQLAFADGTSGDARYEGSLLYNHNDNHMEISTNHATAIYIDSAQKVLIGDTASHTTDLLQIETPASGGGHGIQIRRNDANTDQGIGHILFGNNTATDLVKISAKTDGDSSAGDSGALLFHTQVTGGNLTERMRIDSAGNIGMGFTSPSAWNTDFRAIQLGAGGSGISGGSTGSRNINLNNNAYLSSGGDWKYVAADHAANIEMYDGTIHFRVAGSGSADANISFNEALDIDNSGNVSIGGGAAGTDYMYVADAYNGTNRFPSVALGNPDYFDDLMEDASSRTGSYLMVHHHSGDPSWGGIMVHHAVPESYPSNNSALHIYGSSDFSNVMGVNTSSRVQFNGGFYGSFRRYSASQTGSAESVALVRADTTPGGTGYTLTYVNSAGAAKALAGHATGSDIRLKENINNLENSLDKVLQLQGVLYNRKDREANNDRKEIGFIAQDVENIIPEVINPAESNWIEDPEVLRYIDYEKISVLLVEGMKEQQTQIEELKSEIEVLKNGS